MTKEIYSSENVPLFEAMYGSGLISLGGYPAIDRMFQGLESQQKNILDVGSGLGGMVYYLVQKYKVQATGLEIYPWMVEYGKNNTPDELKDSVQFIGYDPEGKIPVPDGSYDIVCSKGVLTNVINKIPLFKEIHRILKTNGQICFMDWIVPESRGVQHKISPSGEISAKETRISYSQLLYNSGFDEIDFQDESRAYLQYAQDLQQTLHSENFKTIVEPALHHILLEANLKLIEDIQTGDQISVRIVGRKVA